jgi:hypothetical protein
LSPHVNKRQQYAIFFVVAVEECADVADVAELRTGKAKWVLRFSSSLPPKRISANTVFPASIGSLNGLIFAPALPHGSAKIRNKEQQPPVLSIDDAAI